MADVKKQNHAAAGEDLSVHEYHVEQIEEGLQEARSGSLLDYDKVKAGWMKRLDQ